MKKNRTFKFRAWSDKHNKFIYFNLREDFFDPKIFEENFIIHQYIGLCDSKGKDIYEGDLIQIGEVSVSKVIYDSDRFFLESVSTDKIENNYFSISKGSIIDLLISRDFPLNVIGNVVENGDLILEKKCDDFFDKVEEDI